MRLAWEDSAPPNQRVASAMAQQRFTRDESPDRSKRPLAGRMLDAGVDQPPAHAFLDRDIPTMFLFCSCPHQQSTPKRTTTPAPSVRARQATSKSCTI